ncbi:hypothetical protein QBC38DRAFT_520695, partial [Podospora fimiseda]
LFSLHHHSQPYQRFHPYQQQCCYRQTNFFPYYSVVNYDVALLRFSSVFSKKVGGIIQRDCGFSALMTRTPLPNQHCLSNQVWMGDRECKKFLGFLDNPIIHEAAGGDLLALLMFGDALQFLQHSQAISHHLADELQVRVRAALFCSTSIRPMLTHPLQVEVHSSIFPGQHFVGETLNRLTKRQSLTSCVVPLDVGDPPTKLNDLRPSGSGRSKRTLKGHSITTWITRVAVVNGAVTEYRHGHFISPPWRSGGGMLGFPHGHRCAHFAGFEHEDLTG